MERLLIRVLQMSLAGGAVILGILLLRLVLRRAPGRFRYLLWSAAAFRLCVPVTLPSPISLFRLFRGGAVGGGDYTPVGIVQPLENAVPALRGGTVSAPVAAAQTAAVPSPFPWLRLLAWVWLGVLAGLLAYSLVSALLLRRRLAGAVRLEGRVYQADGIGTPFLMGFFHPRIYIPWGLEGKDLDYALAHERVHLRRGDHWWRLLAWLILCVHWFDPLCWLAYLFMGRDMEVSCDEAVLERFGDVRREYSESLLHIAGGKRLSSPAPPAFGESSVVSRVRNVLRWKRAKGWVTVTALCLCLLFIAACATDPVVSGKLNLNPDGTLGKFTWGMSPAEAKALDSRLKTPESTDPIHDFLLLEGVNVLGHTGNALLTFCKYSLEGDLHMDPEGTPVLISIRLVFPGEVSVTDALTGLFGEPEKHALSLNHDPDVKNGLFRPWFDPRELPEDRWYWHSGETVLDLVPLEHLRITYPNAAEQIWASRVSPEDYWLQTAWYARFAYEAYVDVREDGDTKKTYVTISGDAPAFRRYLAAEYGKMTNGKS